MAAYYNEHDKFAAAWLRELIKAGLIADGEVDERDIQDVKADDFRGFVQCHFFAGIGGWPYALRLAGWPDDRPIWTGSCPCQPFSAAGKQKAEDDPRHLWPVWFRLIKECHPDLVVGEQVANAIGHGWLDLVSTDVEGEGYACGAVVLGAHSVGAPHQRQRLWWVAESLHAERGPVDVTREDRRDGTDTGRAEAHGESRTCGEVRDMAHAERAGGESRGAASEPRQGPSAPRTWAPAQSGRRGDTRLVANPGEERLVLDPERDGDSAHRGASYGNDPRGRGLTGELGDPTRARSVNGSGPDGGTRRAGDRSDHAGIMGDANDAGSQGRRERRDGSGERTPWSPGLVEWLPCRDGVWRPVEPGTFPLAYGIPARVGRLRGYGNAIVPQVAAEFIRAYCDITEGVTSHA